MPDLLKLETPDWTLAVWSKDISKSRSRLQNTLQQRNAGLASVQILFNPPIQYLTDENGDKVILPHKILETPVFFENKLYEIDFTFNNVDTEIEPEIHHRLRVVEESFHYSRNSLRGTINTSNDIGWFKLRLHYSKNGKRVEQAISFEVLPVKMDMANDVQKILQVVDKEYPLWRFAFAQKTEYELAQSRKPHERFPLLWLAHFKELQQDLEKAVKQILNAPHTRLLPYEHYLRADRLKGRLSGKLEEKISEHFKNAEYQRRYKITTKKLSVDTPENRFVKMVLVQCVKQLTRLQNSAIQNDKAPDQQRLSDSFFAQLNDWMKPFERFLNRPLFKEVGDFSGMSKESLVLHQKAGYANVYRIWQQLKLYLDVFGQNASASMKSVAELYEVWCLLEIRQILTDLDFKEVDVKKARLKYTDMEKVLVDGMGASFEFYREDGIKIRLAHEPLFSRIENNSSGIHSWTTPQKPDILLEATFADGKNIQWIFDAKYRIADAINNETDKAKRDFAPDDAINQMHRYRDALIHHAYKKDDRFMLKSRPVLGAYVLYPGWYDQAAESNPYTKAIEAVGIGAFALLPGQENQWLRNFLTDKLGKLPKSLEYPQSTSDIHYVEDSARIAYQGMSVTHFQDLALVASAAPLDGRAASYFEHFHNGTANWYHMQLKASVRENIEQAIMREVRFCGVAVINQMTGNREIHFIYPVKSVQLKKRSALTFEQTGKVNSTDDLYWIFELGNAVKLVSPVNKTGIEDHHYMKLTSKSELENCTLWEKLDARYSFFNRSDSIP